ncbi:hypothetical protein DPMN_021549 [Dreissena polymorpha]|uniref:Uncharacterized protein n=1 Tax=Dreissena polymorpha TaxID=45954 RepID=A0A9D4SA20_DREPO|nr:hypothetical protein DPMN_021549 [Dreissena polymorpha]
MLKKVQNICEGAFKYIHFTFTVGNLPRPTTPEEVGARILAQARHGKRKVSGAAMNGSLTLGRRG